MAEYPNNDIDFIPKDPLEYVTKHVEETMKFTDTTCSEILEIILSQDEKKSLWLR